MPTFPFGAPVTPCSADLPTREVSSFVLGAYPSALHVEWRTPDGRRVAALPVDNEPTPFWDGSGADELVERWRVRYFRPEWGEVSPSPLNGSSGRRLYDEWIAPLGIGPDDWFVTDCLDTARMSTGVERRVTASGGEEALYSALAPALGLPQVDMEPHPSESEIVTLAGRHHARLREQLAASQARLVVTLGNAPARVVAHLADETFDRGGRLLAGSYQQARRLTVDGRTYEWHALVHPAVRPPWTETHRAWREARERTT